MEIPGFMLILHDFCEYCPDFEAVVETLDVSSPLEFQRHHNIRCANAKRCASIAENLSKRVIE